MTGWTQTYLKYVLISKKIILKIYSDLQDTLSPWKDIGKNTPHFERERRLLRTGSASKNEHK